MVMLSEVFVYDVVGSIIDELQYALVEDPMADLKNIMKYVIVGKISQV